MPSLFNLFALQYLYNNRSRGFFIIAGYIVVGYMCFQSYTSAVIFSIITICLIVIFIVLLLRIEDEKKQVNWDNEPSVVRQMKAFKQAREREQERKQKNPYE
jgi:uncharacterized membrane protein